MKQYLTAKEVGEIMGISQSKSYGVVRNLNKQLKQDGFITVAGKVPVAYFKEKYYGFKEVAV